jgi:hypothetical protein
MLPVKNSKIKIRIPQVFTPISALFYYIIKFKAKIKYVEFGIIFYEV